jgi:hypothetical protein
VFSGKGDGLGRVPASTTSVLRYERPPIFRLNIPTIYATIFELATDLKTEGFILLTLLIKPDKVCPEPHRNSRGIGSYLLL